MPLFSAPQLASANVPVGLFDAAEVEPVLAVRDLAFAAPCGRVLVEGVSLQLASGERLAIVGPNGAGKTTLLRMLAGTLRPSAGEVRMQGRPLLSMRAAERARLVAVVGQRDGPDGRLRLFDYVGLGRMPHGGRQGRAAGRDIIERSLACVSLAHMADRALATLSGGERQRAQLARALAQEPAVLFLDEPTNHLDPRARADLLRLVAALDLTVVAVLHDLPLVPVFASHVAVMENSRLAALGSPAEALSPQVVRTVFGVDVLRLRHPTDDRELTVFDVPAHPAKSFSAQAGARS